MTTEQRLVQRGFDNIEIEKGKLLDIIKKNREKHISEYKKSVKAYEQAKLAYAQEFWAQLSENIGLLKTTLNEKLENVSDAVLIARDEHTKENGKIDLKDVNASIAFNIQPKVQMTVQQPISHEKEYDVAIRGLELSTAEFVYLNQSDFSRYVLDEWEWKASFQTNNNVLWSGSTMNNHTHFLNAASGISINNLAMANPFGNVYAAVSGCATELGKSTSLYNTIVNTSNLNGGK